MKGLAVNSSEENSTTEHSAFVERRQWPRLPQLSGDVPYVPPALTPLRLSTRDVALGRQFSAWEDHMAPLMDVQLPDAVSPEAPFVADHIVWNLGGMLLVQQSTPALSYERSASKLRFSPIDHWQVSFLRSGKTWTGVDGRVAENEPGKLEIRWLGYPFRGRTLEASSVSLILPSDLFIDHGGMLRANNTVLDGSLSKLLIDYTNSLEANLDRLTAEDLPKIIGHVREMIIDSVSPLLGRGEDVNDQTTQIGLMARARRFVQNNLASPDLTADALSRELAISRTKLYELFETYGGVLNYIRSRRLLAAHAALSDPNNSNRILDIANAACFDSAANFSRAFSQKFGYSPSMVRRHTGSVEVHGLAHQPPNEQEQASFESWLRTLCFH
ncbi:AraC-like DNA-binding protein [Mesorhizobium soli]|uniref:helix-turn-helix transcriptional regulator n=1 Tax=Pseudaminobacter soli (ex Li et al. 2025) TaxID=1295366 RepID=UPI0024737147|nr:AraC family transcriptional regulator [Mesorhizobium soli]MDH6231602.1 AraC-like DNA-binding protein [Mesorhizobium soli]